MHEMDLKLLKSCIDTQLDSYGCGNFSEQLLDSANSKLGEVDHDLKIDHIITAKNQWESCVDVMENHAIIILDDELKVIRANRTVELWGWSELKDIKGSHILNIIDPVVDAELARQWLEEMRMLDIQYNKDWEIDDAISGDKYILSYYPSRDIESIHHDDDCFAALIVYKIKTNRTFSTLSTQTNSHRKMKPNDIDILSREDNIASLQKENDLRYHDLANKLVNTQEYERKRVSSELHDGIGQIISALKFQVESIVSGSKKTARQRKDDQKLDDVLNSIKIALSELRQISVGLRSSVIDELGLLMTLNYFISEFSKVYDNLNIDLQINVDENDIDDKNKHVIYRIVQESVNNIFKHSGADNVIIQLLRSDDHGILLRISDDGCGFDVDKMNQDESSGVGLKSMRERAIETDGHFSISSNPLSGTVVQVYW